MNTIRIEYPINLTDYTLIDSGEGEKLEIFNGYTIVRPDPRAIWKKSQTDEIWNQADATFSRTPHSRNWGNFNSGNEDPAMRDRVRLDGTWNLNKTPPAPWHFHYTDCTFLLKPTDFKHIGIFPEQAVNWDWIRTIIKDKQPSILNLFAYTGGTTAVAAKNGAHVTHVDSVKSTISWAHENCRLSGVPSDRVRWIEDDAYKFVLREGKREKSYDGIIMDPPRFGRGPKGEVWKLEDDLPKLLAACKKNLCPDPLFVLINAYTADLSSLVLQHMIEDLMKDNKGTITFGELAIKESTAGRLLPNGIFCRWEREMP